MPFRDIADAKQILGGVFESAFEHEELGPRLVASGLVVKFDFSEPDLELIIDMANKSVHSAGTTDLKPSAVMAMSCNTANSFWQGKVVLPIAMSRGQIKAEGNVGSLLKLAPITKKMYPIYTQNLQAAGRDDLLL
jgi:putative sterol carrier protein